MRAVKDTSSSDTTQHLREGETTGVSQKTQKRLSSRMSASEGREARDSEE